MIVNPGFVPPSNPEWPACRWKSLGDIFGSPLRAICGACGVAALGELRMNSAADLAIEAKERADFISKMEAILAAINGPEYARKWDGPAREKLAENLDQDIRDARQRLHKLQTALDRGAEYQVRQPTNWDESWYLTPVPAGSIYTGFPDTGFHISQSPRRNRAGEVAGARPHVIPSYDKLHPDHRRLMLAIHERWQPTGQRPRIPCLIVCPIRRCTTTNRVEWPAILTDEHNAVNRLMDLGYTVDKVFAEYRRG